MIVQIAASNGTVYGLDSVGRLYMLITSHTSNVTRWRPIEVEELGNV